MWERLLVLCALLAVSTNASITKVCYDHIGCFTNERPFLNAFGYTPQSPDDIGITFHLHTRANPKQGELLNPNGDTKSVTSTNFNGAQRTILITHGFHGLENNTWVLQMTDAFITSYNANVIVVVWTQGAYQSYKQSVANTRVVGAVMANMVKLLHTAASVQYSQVHLIGHSLGAHACGYAGERLPGLGRITGLDPAGPEFWTHDHRVILDPTDAKFVDIIHTDKSLGYHEPLGHVDFYPYAGQFQDGCLIDSLAGPFYSCSHLRACYYFVESINPHCHFKSRPCANDNVYKNGTCTGCGNGCQDMGYHVSQSARGKFYLSPNWHYPYCHGSH